METTITDDCGVLSPMDWINVKEKLPDEYQEVLVWPGPYIGYRTWYCDGFFWFVRWQGYEFNPPYYTPSHWRPLPDPPKEDI